MNVPAAPAIAHPADISWTAAYPLISHWLYLYYGDISVVEEHWPTLKRFMDGQVRQTDMEGAHGKQGAMPSFWSCGDWCAVESRAVATPNTGPPAAAANYLLAVEAMVAMADALGEAADKQRYSSLLAKFRVLYDATYYNESLVSYGVTQLEVQTMSTVAIGAGAVPAEKEPAVRAALLADITARGHHLTVGATGQKWLLRTLSNGGPAEHDAALAVAGSPRDSSPEPLFGV
jgi:alpha-L-rhamnosidase